ncbi:hypothetical protein BLA29_015338 [Euroglyphus maynei]|uniref:Uncharacterized protein n=1 Tax=Euroglyphus maynei TaxID=6958 RepID=A0A1Y3BCG5_EURMA|nr:hypothetical protein BLA29_015338 [Euroglyphus maynei]
MKWEMYRNWIRKISF